MKDGSLPTVTILGCGYVGLTTAALLANAGVKVYALEINPERLKVIKDGRSFFFEAGLDALIKKGLQNGTLQPTDSYEESVPKSQIVFSCVGTPDNPDGSSNLTFVFDAAKQAATLMKPGTIYAQKSTVPVGTGKKIESLFSEMGKKLKYVSNPEFLREGTAIIDSLWPDRIVTGSKHKRAAEEVAELYKIIDANRYDIAAIAETKPNLKNLSAQYIITSLSSAELIKVTANAFLALKISFANSIAKLADQAEADINEVMDAVGADQRIGRAFLNAGRGYGGGCFPKDVSGLIRSAEEFGVGMEIMNSASEVNNSMTHYIINKTKKAVGGSLSNNVFEGMKIAVLGLSFKAGTSDTRRSPAIAIANTLSEQGAVVHAYDPEAIEEAKSDLDKNIKLTKSIDEAIKGCSIIFVATDWPEFVAMDIAKTAKVSGAKIFVDCMNRFNGADVQKAGLKYIGVGKT